MLYSEKYTILHSQEVDFVGKIQLDIMSNKIYGKVVVDPLWKSAYPLDVVALRDDEVFKCMARMNVFIFGFMISLYDDIEARIVRLIAQIEDELKQRNND